MRHQTHLTTSVAGGDGGTFHCFCPQAPKTLVTPLICLFHNLTNSLIALKGIENIVCVCVHGI